MRENTDTILCLLGFWVSSMVMGVIFYGTVTGAYEANLWVSIVTGFVFSFFFRYLYRKLIP